MNWIDRIAYAVLATCMSLFVVFAAGLMLYTLYHAIATRNAPGIAIAGGVVAMISADLWLKFRGHLG